MTTTTKDRGLAIEESSNAFVTHRALLFSIAYEMLGSVADAEDAVQECWLRWQRVDQARVSSPRAYLAQMVTRQALMLLRTSRRRRETYVGPWLPEPLETASGGLEHVLAGEAVTVAMLLVLERLTPVQRAVFVLREVFCFDYAEIADAVDRSEAAVRQVAHRARTRVRTHDGGNVGEIAVTAEARATAESFGRAVVSADVQALMDVLAPDVVYLADGGGRVSAVRRPLRGRHEVVRFLTGLVAGRAGAGHVVVRLGEHNATPSLAVEVDGALDHVMTLEITSGRVRAVYCVRNPDKLVAA